jgi:hypothetical protein
MEEKAELVCSYFKNNKPFLIGRNGSTELEVLSYFIKNGPNTQFPQFLMNRLETYSGIFPATQESVKHWVLRYVDSLYECDAIAEGWYEPLKIEEKILLDAIIPKRDSLFLRNLEPYYFDESIRWSKFLENKNVGIINSFAKTCEEQTYLSKAIWGKNFKSLLPSNTRWIPIQTYFPPKMSGDYRETSWPLHINNWEQAIDYVLQSYKEDPFEVAIVGCGALGMIIGAELKKKGVQVILMGGATQILFGVRGKRWETHSVISKFFNDAWVYPKNKPANAKLIENACYW